VQGLPGHLAQGDLSSYATGTKQGGHENEEGEGGAVHVRPLAHGQFLAALAPDLPVTVPDQQIDARVAQLQQQIARLQTLADM
jgi:hypothetical protein